MTVVADTSVLLNLCFLRQEAVLHTLFGDIHVPPQVAVEFQRLAKEDSRFQGLKLPAFIIEKAPLHLGHEWADSPVLHSGEVAALSLALEMRAELVLMDESEGRAVAKTLQLRTMGLLGVLLQARHKSLIPKLAPFLDQLQLEARFWMAPSLRAAVLAAAGELA